MALYATATIAATDKLVFYPGIRAALNGVVLKRAGIDPRLRWGWKFLRNTTFKGGPRELSSWLRS